MKKSPVIIILVILLVILGVSLLLRTSEKDETGVASTPADTSDIEDNTIIFDDLQVMYTDSGFIPASLTTAQSDNPRARTVTFINNSSRNMWVASDPHPTHTGFAEFDTKRGLAPGETYTITFPVGAENYTYHNHLSARDRGVIIVQ